MGFQKGVMKDWRDAGKEECKNGGMQEWRNAEKEECRKGGVQENNDAVKEGCTVGKNFILFRHCFTQQS